VARAVYVVSAAVDRYKELCEGKYNGERPPAAAGRGWVESSHLLAVMGRRRGWVVEGCCLPLPPALGAALARPPNPTASLAPAPPGCAVPRVQRVLGFEFSYQPPPKSTVPGAASLKGAHVPLPGTT
jgi:hypothetical protein